MLDDALQPLFESLARFTIWFSLAVLLVLMLRPLLRRLGARFAYQAWLLPLLALGVQQLPADTLVHAPSMLLAAGAGLQSVRVDMLPSGSGSVMWILLLWTVGALLCAVRMAAQYRGYARNLVCEHADASLRAPDARSPALIGIFRPRLVLPFDFEDRFNALEQTLIHAHESAHACRRDNLWNALAAGLLCLQWFNPLAHIALRLMRADQEMSCDARVLHTHPECLAAYAKALLKAQSVGMPNLFACQWHLHHPLVERITMLKHHTPTRSARLAAQSLLLTASLIATGAIYATQSSQLDSTHAAHYRIAMEFQIDGKAGPTPVVVTRAGEVAKVTIANASGSADTSAAWDIEVIPQTLSDNRIELNAVISYDTPPQVIARPRLIANEGETARIVQTLADGHTVGINLLGTRLESAQTNTLKR